MTKNKTSIALNLGFPSNTILSCFFLFFLMIDFHFLNPAVASQFFNPTTELRLPTGISTNETNAQNDTQLVTTEVKISKCST